MKKVIIINGVARAGKDSFADFLIKRSKNTATKISTVDSVKEMCLTMFGADPNNKCNKNRKLWCDFKNLWTSFNNGPFKDVVKFIEKSDKNIFCVFAREPTEIQKFKDFYGSDCITILIRRDGLQIPDNTADKEVENYEYDYYIYSKSLEYLDKKAKELYHKIDGWEIMRIAVSKNTKIKKEKIIEHFTNFE
jgi:hypothetical protein